MDHSQPNIMKDLTTTRLLLTIIAGLLAPVVSHAQVRRAEVIATADAYLTFKWKAGVENAFHGKDADGVQVNTPDISFSQPGIRPGWWMPKKVNIGMPYMWGGFSTLDDFKVGIQKGFYAGDVYTAEKRRLNDTAVSKYAVGIDCSGLVSRCWKLERAYSTHELPAICVQLASFDELNAGDILNSPNNHVLIFKAFTDSSKTRLLAYEAGSPPTWKVLLNDIPISMLKDYAPLRYQKIKD